MSHITEVMLSVPDGTDKNAVNVAALQAYCRSEGDSGDWVHHKMIAGNVLSNDLYLTTLRHCYLDEFLACAASLPWHRAKVLQLFINDEDWDEFRIFGPSAGWALPFDPHVDEHGVAREDNSRDYVSLGG